MRYFFDTEFNQEVDPVQLISLGMVADDGREFYAISEDFDWSKCDEWLEKNVLDRLLAPILGNRVRPYRIEAQIPTPQQITMPLAMMRHKLERFIGEDPDPEFWAYCADYDWYLFTRLWGFRSMPKTYPFLCLDLQQHAYHVRVDDLEVRVPALEPQHNALVDARWTYKAWKYVETVAREPKTCQVCQLAFSKGAAPVT